MRVALCRGPGDGHGQDILYHASDASWPTRIGTLPGVRPSEPGNHRECGRDGPSRNGAVQGVIRPCPKFPPDLP